MWDGFEKRRFPRIRRNCEIRIEAETQPTILSASTENVGAGGVCVHVARHLSRFSKCHVKMDLDQGFKVDCEGRVIWAIPMRHAKGRPLIYDTGIEFMGIDSVTVGRIRTFLEELVL